MKRLLASIALVLCVATSCQTNHAKAACQEDDPCWNWVTMGNHCRGDHTSTTICAP